MIRRSAAIVDLERLSSAELLEGLREASGDDAKRIGSVLYRRLVRAAFKHIGNDFKRIGDGEVEDIIAKNVAALIMHPASHGGVTSPEWFVITASRRDLMNVLRSPRRLDEVPLAHAVTVRCRSVTAVREDSQTPSVLDELPERQREVLRMHLNGVENAEIARMLEISVGAVRSALHYAKKAVKARKRSRHGRLYQSSLLELIGGSD